MTEKAPYPLSSLPEAIEAAVKEAAGTVQTPAAMAAISALSALSLGAQKLADIQLPVWSAAGISLYFLALAVSAERKTSLDRMFMQPFQAFADDARMAGRSVPSFRSRPVGRDQHRNVPARSRCRPLAS